MADTLKMSSTAEEDPILGFQEHKIPTENDGDGSFPPTHKTSFNDEMNSLKQKILELESRHINGDRPDSETSPVETKALAEMEQYKRMEECLYKHRKEWEVNEGPGKWGMYDDTRRNFDFGGHAYLLWFKHIVSSQKYERPDVFDPRHNCGVDRSVDPRQDIGKMDEYDLTIDWGSRRERIRKNFEWDMDRLFLSEELQNRKKIESKRVEEKKRREQRMAEIDAQADAQRQPEETASGVSKVEPPKMAWLEWNSFKISADMTGKIANVIDVLIGEPVVDVGVGKNRFWFRYSNRRQMKQSSISVTDQKAVDSVDPTKSSLPERIRIRSDVLLRILAEVLGSDGRSLLEQEDMRTIFIRPFKALIYRENALREWCYALEKKFARSSSNKQWDPPSKESPSAAKGLSDDKIEGDGAPGNINVGSMSPDSPSDQKQQIEPQGCENVENKGSLPIQATESDSENDSDEDESKPNTLTRSPKALEHLRCLLKFLDSSVAAKANYFNSSECRKVFFSDLWQFFRPGVEIIGSDGKQAYKVIGVNSAKHRILSPWERWYLGDSDDNQSTGRLGANRKKADFSITCVYIDFDGKNIGPVKKEFEFKRFDGQKEITSLEVYPLRFHPVQSSEYNQGEWQKIESVPPGERCRQKLVRRGEKFLDVAGGKHMYYAGQTLESKDEVESPVVVDFETTFIMHDISKPKTPQNPMMPPLKDDELQDPDVWKPRLETLIGTDSGESGSKEDTCSGECCRDEYVYDDQYVDSKQRTEYIDSLLPKGDALDEQPPISIMPRPLKTLVVGAGGKIICPEDELVIMSYRVFGFVLRSRKFAKLDLTYLSDIHTTGTPTEKPETRKNDNPSDKKINTEHKLAFDRLVLEKGHDSMIVSLIAQHFRDKKSATGEREEFDIVKGKGKGLILLLHGAPGVGKTSTAEGVAELFKKPLFQITCGDLGTTAAEVETALEKNFSLASKWDCILLLDEADVFLAERTKEDFKRNGLVAVFLRLMEYYSGILFLTTNRVGDFDEAFTSRIHVSLYYPELNEEKTIRVFEINMDMIEYRFQTKGRTIKVDRPGIIQFAAKYFAKHTNARWNGRQIRNACQTALALAEFEAQGETLTDTENPNIVVNLRVDHFKVVRNAYLEFTKYMHELYGSTSARRAKESKLRAVWFDEHDRVVRTQNMEGTDLHKKNAFFAASQIPPSRPQGHSPQQSFHQQGYQNQARYQQQPSPSTANYQTQFHLAPNQPQQPFPTPQTWDYQAARNPNAYAPEQQYEAQFQAATPLRQPGTPSPHRPQHPVPGFNENIRNMYEPSSPPSDEQAAAGAGRPAGQNWD